MSNDLSHNILTHQYGARIQEGQYRWRDAIPYEFSRRSRAGYPDYFTDKLSVIETRSVQVDIHPADFKRLVDALEYLHTYRSEPTTASQQMLHKQHPADGYAEHVYKQQWREEELRQRHPLLQDLWQQYQMTLNLIASGQHKDDE